MNIREFRKSRTCDKCGNYHLLKDPQAVYLKAKNVLVRTCTCCGYQWLESVYDGTRPVQPRRKKIVIDESVTFPEMIDNMIDNFARMVEQLKGENNAKHG